jgi:hypothetical protein
MVKITPTLRFAALGAMVLGLAFSGFVASASAEDAGKAGEPKPVSDVNAGAGGNNSSLRSNDVKDVHGEGNDSSLRSNNVKDVNAGNGGNASNLRSNSLGVGSGGNPTGEGALLSGNCFADMPVYNKEGKFIGRGIVNTCN